MIKNPTVFVLGAGASCDYGFPSGAQLCSSLTKLSRYLPTSAEETNAALLRASEFVSVNREHASRFCRDLRDSQCLSIDEFLALGSGYEEIGKLAIASELIPFESPEAFASTSDKGKSFYHLLLAELLSDGPEHFAENKLTVVTLNYDRSLEAFLYMALTARFTESRAQELAPAIRIIHPHGTLGPFDPSDGKGRAYSPRLSDRALIIARDSIRIIHETTPTEGAFAEAKRAIEEARDVYFLGFAYHEAIMRRLFTGVPAANVRGTALGLTPKRLTRIKNAYHIETLVDHRAQFSIVPFLQAHRVL